MAELWIDVAEAISSDVHRAKVVRAPSSSYPAPMLLLVLDVSLSVLHTAVIVANLTLWLPRSTRRLHLCLVALTAASWFGLGAIYGMGYCVLTDWHWDVKRARGVAPPAHSFIQHLCSLLGIDLSPATVDLVAAVGFGVVVCLSVALNAWDLRGTRASRRGR